MADTTNLTQEQIVALLVELFVNQNNLDKTYYDMFYNTTPMDIQIQRYDELGVLQTYTIPNRAKDSTVNGLMILGTVVPEGIIQASAGQLYLNTSTYILYYKATGDSTSAYGWLQLYSPVALENGAFAVDMGGTGVTSISGIIRGNGTQAFSQATEYMGDIVPTDASYNIENGNINADYMNPTSVINKINNTVNTHNTSSTAHTDIRTSISNLDSSLSGQIRALSGSINNLLGVPDYANAVTKNWGVANTAEGNGWIYATANTGSLSSATLTINNFTMRFSYGANDPCGASIFVPVVSGDTYLTSGGSGGTRQLYFIPNR